jgi:hypothetical protein
MALGGEMEELPSALAKRNLIGLTAREAPNWSLALA